MNINPNHHYIGRNESGIITTDALERYLGEELTVKNRTLFWDGEETEFLFINEPERLSKFVDDKPVDAEGNPIKFHSLNHILTIRKAIWRLISSNLLKEEA